MSSSAAHSHIYRGGQSACPSGRSVPTGGSGSIAAYASHYSLRDAVVLLCFFWSIRSVVPSAKDNKIRKADEELVGRPWRTGPRISFHAGQY
ncbi:MAG: hypothetical protein GXY18_15375 [Methanomicrobiales archaeon]|nr:hypothetical protein [Methanomicrobiales archaeon]